MAMLGHRDAGLDTVPEADRRPAPRGGLATPRSRGAVSGFLLLLLGAWGALVPFVGPYFHFAYTPNDHWHWTTGRLWLEVAPGAVAFVGGLLVLSARNRVTAMTGAWAAIAAGGWLVVGPVLTPIIDGSWLGRPTGGTDRQVWEQLGFFYALGAVIVLFAAFALGRFSVVSVRDVGLAERRAEERARAEQARRDREAQAAAEAQAAREQELARERDAQAAREAEAAREQESATRTTAMEPAETTPETTSEADTTGTTGTRTRTQTTPTTRRTRTPRPRP